MGDLDAGKLAVRAISGSLRTDENRMGGELDPFSSKPFPPEWRPKNYGEIWVARRRAIKYLERIGEGDDDAAALARRTRLTSVSALSAEDAVAVLETTTPLDDEERRIIMEASTRLEQIPDLPEGLRLRLLGAKEQAFGNSFFDLLRRWVGKRLITDYDLAHESGYASADQKVVRLAEDAAEKGLSTEELKWLATPEAENVWPFGHRLGELDADGSFEAPIKEVTEDNFNCVLLASYFTGRYPAGMEAELSAAIDEIAQSKPKAAFGATWRVGPSESGAKRAIRLVQDRLVDPSAFEMLRYGPFLPHLPLKYVIQIVELLLDTDPIAKLKPPWKSSMTTCEINPPPSSNSESRHGRRSRPCRQDAVSHTFDWRWGRIAAPLAVANPARFARAFVGLFESDETWLATDSAQHCLRTAATADPAGVWDVIGPALMREDQTGMRLRIKLEHWFGELLPPDLLVSWAKRNGRKGFLHAAALLSVRSGAPSEAARLLVREAKIQTKYCCSSFRASIPGLAQAPSPASWNATWSPFGT